MNAGTILAPLRRRGTYASLAFLASGLPLGVAWFTLLVTGWSLGVSLCITFIAGIAVLLALAEACRWGAEGERRIANALIGAGLPAGAPRQLPRGPIARLRAWIADGAAWREQAYLLLRFVAGLPMGTVVISLAGSSLALVAAPAWYWAPPDGAGILDAGPWEVDTLGEAFAVVPIGLAGVVLSTHLAVWSAAAWRGMARGLLGGGLPPASALPASPPRPGRARRAFLVHAGVAALTGAALVAIWALTAPGGYFWPVWPLLGLALAVAVHAAVWTGLRSTRSRPGLWIHAGITAALVLFLVGVWAASTPGGYFWPAWPALGLGLALGVHAVVAYVRRGERIEELQARRAGAVDAQAAELRRIERDLHDGAQARLVALAMDLGMAEQKLDADPDAARRLVGEARAEAKRALVELRELVQGIHPPLLADRGLEAAVAALAARSPVPVTVTAEVPGRAGAAVESAAYFTVAEALANAAKHSGAGRIDVRLARRGDTLVVEVDDDGAGGADPGGGGLSGLRRRVEALDGRLTVFSPPGGGTLLRAELPCGS